MATRTLPEDMGAEWARISDRVGGVSARLVTLDGHVKGAAVAGKIATLKELTDSIHDRVKALEQGGPGKPAGGAGGEEEEEEEGQRNWFTVAEVETAHDWLECLQEWHDSWLCWRIRGELPLCWPWHPVAVEELLAIEAHYQAVFAGADPIPLSDYLTRWWPAARDRIVDGLEVGLKVCGGAVHVDTRSQAWTVSQPRRLFDVASWWVQSRGKDDPPGLAKQ